MTRKEDIKLTARKYCFDDYTAILSFVAGAEWADEHPVSCDNKTALYFNDIIYKNGYEEAVDKACKWLKDYAHVFVSETTGDLDEDDLIYAFRKAMKGE